MLDLQFKYNPWITLTVLHHYFEDQVARDFRLVPSDDTQRLSRKMGFLIKDTPNGMVVLYDALHTEALRDYLKQYEVIKLSFYLYFSDPYLFTYTNLPLFLNSTAYIFYFSNEGASDRKLLHTQTFVSGADACPAKPNNLELNYDSPPQKLSIRHGQITVMELKPEAGQTCYIDLSEFKEGKYSLYENEVLKEEFITLNINSLKRPFALLDFNISGTVAQEMIQHIQHLEDIPEQKYEIALDTRHTYWKYYIVPKYGEGLESLYIDTGDKKIKFSGPMPAKLPNGADAYLFESEQALSLKEISPYKFQLIKQKDAKGKDAKKILRRLPCPNLGSIKPESKDKDAKIYSEIIVYI